MTLSSSIDFWKFGLNPVTGFFPQQEPLRRLPSDYNAWEELLASAMEKRLQRSATKGLTEEGKAKSEAWRARIRELPVLSIKGLKISPPTLARAHHVLAFLVHYYIHTLSTDAELRIPSPIALPFLRISAELGLPPVMSFSDNILSNWTLRDATIAKGGVPSVNNLKMRSYFTGHSGEEAFYVANMSVELRGGEALQIAQVVLRMISENSGGSHPTITGDVMAFLQKLVPIIKEMRELTLDVRSGCDTDFFYREIRPWLLGGDSDPTGRKWIFEGIETDPSLREPMELSGSSGAQSPLVQALDIFFGIHQAQADEQSNAAVLKGDLSSSFAKRMRTYMSTPQRSFLDSVTAYRHVLRDFVKNSRNPNLKEAYNQGLLALKDFRDGHMVIATLYIIQPARRLAREEAEAEGPTTKKVDDKEVKDLKGSAGGDLARLLKEFRDKTTTAVL